MEASGSSGNSRSVPPKQLMTEIMGMVIAIITLTLPILTIAYFSPNPNTNTIPRTTYSLPNIKK